MDIAALSRCLGIIEHPAPSILCHRNKRHFLPKRISDRILPGLIGVKLPKPLFLVELAHQPHLHASRPVNGLCPGYIKAVKKRHLIFLPLLPDYIPDSLSAVGIAAAPDLHGQISHTPYHSVRTQTGSVFLQGRTELIKGFPLHKGLIPMLLQKCLVIVNTHHIVPVAGLIQGKIHPVLILIVGGKGPFIGIMGCHRMAVAVKLLHIQSHLPPLLHIEGLTGLVITAQLPSQGPHHRKRSVAGHNIPGQILILLHIIFNRHKPGKAQGIYNPLVRQVIHPPVQFLLIKPHIGQIRLLPVISVPSHHGIASQIRLINRIALLCPAVYHSPEHAVHPRMIGFLPFFPVGKLPVRISQPEKRRPVGIGKVTLIPADF